MIQLIYSEKGTGKTKRLIDIANADMKQAKGDVVFIDDDKRYMYDVVHQIRFVDVTEYKISGCEEFYGFLCGMVSQNFDIESFYIDAFLKIVKKNVDEIEDLMKKIEELCEKNNIKAVIIVSADPKSAPDYMKKYII
jgi:archaellum biogenesis ATPase FlaH